MVLRAKTACHKLAGAQSHVVFQVAETLPGPEKAGMLLQWE